MRSRALVLNILHSYWIVLLAPFLLLSPLLLTGKVLFWGTPSLQFIPWWSYALECLRDGVLPLWNPLNGMGAPLLANYQTAFFYPPNWTLLFGGGLFGDQGIAFTFLMLAGLHLAWAGLGMALLLRKLGVAWLGQVIGGLTFGLSGFVVARLGFFSMVWASSWAPWIFLNIEYLIIQLRTSDNIARRFPSISGKHIVPGLLLCLTMQLFTGHAQLTWYSLVLAFLWLTFRLFDRKSIRPLVMGWFSFLATFLLAAGIAAVQLVPTFEYLKNSQRASAFAYDNAMTYSFWPWRFVTFFSPDFFGNPSQGNFWGYANYWEDHFYIGLMPLVIAISTIRLIFNRQRSGNGKQTRDLVIFSWAIILASFLLALGKNTAIFPFLYWNVPTFNMFQAPTRFLFWAAVFLPILAAVGIHHWRCPSGKGLYWFRLATAGTFAISLGAGLASIFLDNIQLTFIKSTALTGFWGLSFGILTLLLPAAEKRGLITFWRAGAILITLTDLCLVGWNLNPGIELDFYSSLRNKNGSVASANALGRVYLDPTQEYDLKFKRFFRFKDFQPIEDWSVIRQVQLPNLNLLSMSAIVLNFDPLVSSRYQRWIDVLDRSNPEVKQDWLKFSNVSSIEQIDLREEEGVRFSPLQGAQRWHWYSCSEPVQNADEALSRLTEEMKYPPQVNRKVILEINGSQQIHTCLGDKAAVIWIVSDRPDQVVFEVQAQEAGWLEIMDSWYPGWVATVSGQRTEVVPADFLFKAVYVEKGNHIVIISYRPSGFYLAGLFSILVLLFVLFLFLRHRGYKRKRI